MWLNLEITLDKRGRKVEGGRCDETIGKKVTTLQTAMTKKSSVFFLENLVAAPGDTNPSDATAFSHWSNNSFDLPPTIISSPWAVTLSWLLGGELSEG